MVIADLEVNFWEFSSPIRFKFGFFFPHLLIFWTTGPDVAQRTEDGPYVPKIQISNGLAQALHTPLWHYLLFMIRSIGSAVQFLLVLN